MSKLVRARARADEDYRLFVSALSRWRRHRITAPSADATSPAARSTVAFAPTGSASAEFTSTTSSDPRRPVAAAPAEEVGLSVSEAAADRRYPSPAIERIARIHIKRAVQRTVITEVVEGRIYDMTDALPINIVHRAHEGALSRNRNKILRSSASTSRKPTKARFCGARRTSSSHSKADDAAPSSDDCTSFSRKASGMPCALPDGLVEGELQSACASTQSTLVAGRAFSAALTVPRATEWSPPNVKTKLPRA